MTLPKPAEDDSTDDIMALGRMVSYACQQARAMDLNFSSYCLEVALTALIQDMAKVGVSMPIDLPALSLEAKVDLH